MNKSVQHPLVILSGLVTSFLTACLLSWIEVRWGHALYSFTFWFVIPIGAICVGMMAATGFMIAARVLNVRPARSTLAVIIVSSMTMFVAIQWLDYTWMTVDGQAISSAISFQDFLSFTISHTSMQVGVRGHFSDTGIQLGGGGYLFVAVQIVGFLIGGVSIYLILTGMTYCERCSKYFSAKGSQLRYYRTAEDLQEATSAVLSEMQTGRVQHSVLIHASGGSESSKDAFFSSDLELKECKGCGRHWTKFQGKKKAGNEWKEISGLSLAIYSEEPIELHRTLTSR